MVLVDTSVWIDHLRRGEPKLKHLLERVEVLAHTMVLGELAMGNLKTRGAVLSALAQLPQAVVAREPEVLAFIERNRLYGRGIGYLDAHLLASTQLTPHAQLWTRDRRLRLIARELSLANVSLD